MRNDENGLVRHGVLVCSLTMSTVEKAMLSRESHHWKKAIQAIIEENCNGRFTGVWKEE